MYEWLKHKYTGLKTAWDHCNIACEAEIVAKNQTIENLAKKFFPEYDSERYHYYEANEWREDFEETPEEEDYNERCESAYRDAAAYINEYYSEFKIAERHTEIKKKISAEISDLAKQAKNVDANFWHGEPWEREFRSWDIVPTMD